MGWRKLKHSISVKPGFSSTQDINDSKPQFDAHSWLKPFAVINLPHVGWLVVVFFSSVQNDPETECRFKPISSPGSYEWPSGVDMKWTVSVTCPSVPEPWLLRARCHSARRHLHTHARAHARTHAAVPADAVWVACPLNPTVSLPTQPAYLPTRERRTRIWSFISSSWQEPHFFPGGAWSANPTSSTVLSEWVETSLRMRMRMKKKLLPSRI